MPAIVRQTMSRTLARDLLTDVQNSVNEYYIGIAKSDVFNGTDSVIDPVDCLREEREFRNNLQSIKKVEGSTMVAKRVNWSYGSIYAGWDDTVKSDIDENWTPFYVLTDAKEVYVCLEQGTMDDGTTKQSIVEPNFGLHAPISDVTDPNDPMYGMRLHWKPFTTADGYVWKYLYSLTPERIYNFLSSNHFPVQEAEESLAAGDAIEDLQFQVKDNAVNGQIIRATVTSSGSGHSTAPQVIVHGDGTGAIAEAVINESGEITKIRMTDYGLGYTHASFEIVGGTESGSAEPVITSKNGLGYDPIDDLKTSSVMVNIKPDGTVNDTFVVQNTFRQMGLIKNPLQTDNTTPYTDISAKVLPSMVLVNDSPFEKGGEIVGAQSGARAYVDDNLGAEVFYHQNLSTGFERFDVGEAVTQTGVVLTGQIDDINLKNVIDRFSGDVLYIENRARIRRDEEQQEDIKIVITV